jgi:hypothetical protein
MYTGRLPAILFKIAQSTFNASRAVLPCVAQDVSGQF